jgi:hypothetical protein
MNVNAIEYVYYNEPVLRSHKCNHRGGSSINEINKLLDRITLA